MKMLRNILLFLLLCGWTPLLLKAQQNEFKWRIGAYGGVMTYYGDLSYRFVDPNPRLNDFFFDNLDYGSYGFSVERRLSNAFSVGLLWTEGQFIANDRSIDWDGDFQFQNPDFGRALNAQTELWDASLFFTYHFDNGFLLGRRAFVAPYLKAGAGLTHFTVFGDLFNELQGRQRYYYWDDGNIRDQPPGTPGAALLEQDGIYETNLTSLQTEGTDYNQDVLSVSGGLGLKFRLGRFNLNIESLIRWVDTDYLDDVSGGPFLEKFDSELQEYASNPAGISREQRGESNRNDLYAFSSVSLHYNFGRKENDFSAPPIVFGPLFEMEEPVVTKPVAEPKTMTPSVTEEKTDSLREQQLVDSLQYLIDSLRKELSDAQVHKMRSDRAMADSLRLLADSLQMRADSLLEQADELYPAPVDTTVIITIADTTVTDTSSIEDASIASEARDTILVKEDERPQQPATDSIQTDTLRTTAPSPTDTLRTQDAEVQPPPDTVTIQVDTMQSEDETVRPATSPDTVTIQVDTMQREDETVRPVTSPDTVILREDTLQSEEEAVQPAAPRDTATIRELNQLRDQLAILSAQMEDRPQPDTASQARVRSLERDVQEMQAVILEMQDRLDRPVVIQSDSLPAPEQLEVYREEMEALRRRVDEMEEELPAEEQRLVTQYETRLREIERVDPDDDNRRYRELQREIDRLRRQLNITTGIGAAAGVAAAATRPRETQPDTMVNHLQSRIDTLERTLSLLQRDPALRRALTGADTTLYQRFEELDESLDSISRRERLDPTTALLRANIQQQRDSLRQQRQLLQQQQETARELQQRMAALEAQLATLRSTTEDVSVVEPERQREVVFFDTGSSQLNISARQVIERVAEKVNTNPDWRIRLEGYTDSSGSLQVNQRLSRQRTLAVRTYLLERGIAPERITTAPQGIDTNAPSPAYGRRVELILETSN